MTPTITGVRFFEPGKAYAKIKDVMLHEINRVLSAGDLILRDDVELFERNLANFCGSKFAVALNSGTDALYLSLWALGIKAGDEVLVPSHTFVATAQVVKQLGATPVLYDMDANIEFSEKTRCLMVAHIAGEITADMRLVSEIANERGIPVVEDACQSLGATQHGQMAGTWGKTGCFSFYPAKILGAYGDAGAIITDDLELYTAIKDLRNHCKSDYKAWGINSRMDNMQAAVLNVKMRSLSENLLRRAQIAKMYDEAFKDLALTPPRAREGRVYQDYIVLFPTAFERDAAYDNLKKIGIETMKNEYPMPIGKLPIAADYEARTLRLPCNDVLSDGEVEYVITGVKSLFQ